MILPTVGLIVMALHKMLTGFASDGGLGEHGEQNQGIGIHGGHNVNPETRPTVKLSYK